VRAPLIDDETRSMARPPAPGRGGPPPRAAAAATRRAAAPTEAVAARPAPAVARPPAAPRSRPPPARPGTRRSGGRRWLTVLGLLLLPAAAYLAAVQLMTRTGTQPPPPTQAAPAVTRGATTCAWTEPAVGTPDRVAPLDAMRARLGVGGQFAGVDMRMFTGPAGLKRWYVKAYQQDDRSRRGRWLVDEQVDGAPRVVAEADYDTRGYRRADWRGVGGGVRGPAAALAACLAGT
jgi:hypothetical protein